MKKLIVLFVLFSFSAFADALPSDDGVVCYKPKPKVKKKKVAPKPPPPVVCPPAPEAKCCPVPEPKVITVENKTIEKEYYHTVIEKEVVPPTFGLGVRGAVGVRTCDNLLAGLAGVRGRWFPGHLGLDLNYTFVRGPGITALFYPIQGDALSWNLNAGVTNPLSSQKWGFASSVAPVLGTGLELRLAPHVSLTGDVYGLFPTTSQASLQALLGLMLHTW